MVGSKEVCNRAPLQTSLVGGRGNQKNWGKKCKSLIWTLRIQKRFHKDIDLVITKA